MGLPAIRAAGPERIQLPDVRRPDQMPSLPAWVASRLASMKDELQAGQGDGKWRTVPTWAVAAAVRRWYRGECGTNERGQPYDYHWRPAPAELRKTALVEKWRIASRADTLRKLLTAEPLIEHSDDHCKAMRTKLAEMWRGNAMA
jgi:hypothetical protein